MDDKKLRRVRHELEPVDVIEAIVSVVRIDGAACMCSPFVSLSIR